LSSFQSQKTVTDADGNILAAPDENFARELMQLFSIGLLELHPNGMLKLGQNGQPLETHTQTDVTELARVMTGWGRSVKSLDATVFDSGTEENDDFLEPLSANYWDIDTPDHWTPMKQFSAYHDESEKSVLGHLFPAGVDGEAELEQVAVMLADHPNSGPFIARRMIQRLTTSNPSAGYVYRVNQAYLEADQELGAMVRAILLDPEVRNPSTASLPGSGRIKEPLLQAVNLCRIMHCGHNMEGSYALANLTTHGLPAGELDLYDPDAKRQFISYYGLNWIDTIQQAPFSAPSVFNWFNSDFSPIGPMAKAGLKAPELEHLSNSTIVSYHNLIYNMANSQWDVTTTKPHFSTGRAIMGVTLPPDMIAAYTAVMDTNGDGEISADDDAFTSGAKIHEATAAVVDLADDYFCQGWLKANATGDPETDPREIIITGLQDMRQSWDNNTTFLAGYARNSRVRESIMITLMAPTCTVQK
ncbi:MAG: DUF1800 family protein, partial [Chloroflexota bacterium]